MTDSKKPMSSAGALAGPVAVSGQREGAAQRLPAELTLYGTAACHLCDEARRLVAPLAQAFGWALQELDVAEDDALFERYGERVPVLVRTDLDIELDWPFDARVVRDCVAAPRAVASSGKPFTADR